MRFAEVFLLRVRERRRRAADLGGMGAEHSPGGGLPRSGVAQPSPRESNLGVEVLLRGGLPDEGPDGDGGLPVLL